MQMSSWLSGGGRAYGFDLDIVKSPLSSTITSQTSSPSSTLSESSNSPRLLSTRKPRTPRKRPNQMYNEAAALLTTACPIIFSPKHLSKPFKFSKPYDHLASNPSADLLLPFRVFDNSGYLIHPPIPEKPNSRIETRVGNLCENPQNSSESIGDCMEDFDAESILDEEVDEGGIDSIMGKLSVDNNKDNNENSSSFSTSFSTLLYNKIGTCYGYPMGNGFGEKIGFSRAFRHVDEGEWCRFPQIDVVQISPKLLINKTHIEKKKKRVGNGDVSTAKQEGGNSISKSNPGLLLKLNFDEVANAWSDRGSPFSDDVSGQDMTGGDIHIGSDRFSLGEWSKRSKRGEASNTLLS